MKNVVLLKDNEMVGRAVRRNLSDALIEAADTDYDSADVIDAPVTEYANDIRPLSAEAVQEFLDVNEASDSDEMHVFRAFDSAYDMAGFLKGLADFGPTKKYVKPGTFRR